MKELKLRTESIRNDSINDLAVLNDKDERLISSLVLSEPCLIEGSRGTGKSFLMKLAELRLNKTKNVLPVFVTFHQSSLVNTDDELQFYHWMLAKTLKFLLNSLRKSGLSISNYSKSLLSNDTSQDEDIIENDLRKIVKNFETSYKNSSESVDISTLPDIEDVKEVIKEICEQNNLERIYLFFDEAAHVFRPEQQRQFFNLFKDLRSPYITCNAAIYPGVTHFGSSFEPTHDCIYEIIDRNIADENYIKFFREMVIKQTDDNFAKSIEKNGELFDVLALSCGGNPRLLLQSIQAISKFNTSNVNQVIKELYLSKIWHEHTILGNKYKGHQALIDWGRDFIENSVIPKIAANERSSIYFWIDKDVPETVKESLRLLTYTSILRQIGGLNRAHKRLGYRYEIKFGCIIAIQSQPIAYAKELRKKRSLKQYTEFSRNNPEYDKVVDASTSVFEGDDYQESLNSILAQSVDVLTLTTWQKEKLKSASYLTIRDLYNLSEEDLISNIYGVAEKRARTMINAIHSEILEYISG